jgi:uncharacterized repeat protein (TIGR01451 family)
MNRRLKMISGVVLALAWSVAPASAQILRSFTSRYTTNTPGDIAIIGNTLHTSPTPPPGASEINNNLNMVRVDADGDSSTFDSSSANLALPSGATLLYARLYWGAGTNAGSGGVRAPNPTVRNQVKLRFGSSSYSTITADTIDSDTISGGAQQALGRYQGTANITSFVRNNGNGTYWVADVQSGTGENTLAGWAIVAVYSDPTAPPRNLTVYDGYANVFNGTGASVTIPVSGFLTPRYGTVNTRLGWVVYEGDNGGAGGIYRGEQVRLNGTTIPLPTDTLNPQNDCFNSSITRLGVRISGKSPDYANQLGFDVDVVNANGVLPNNASNATIVVSSNGEQFYPGAITFATELYAPIITIPKTVSDVNGNKLNPGDELEYTVTVTDTGGDDAENCALTDFIPTHTTYVTNSFQIATGPNAGPKTDAPGDDQLDFVSGRLAVRLGTGANATAGGVLTIGQSTSFKFRVKVDLNTPDGTSITNQATFNYDGVATGVTFAQASTTASVEVDAGIKGRVFEDVNYGGGAGRSFSNATGAAGIPNARVELYDAANNFVRAILTDANGNYVFSNATAGAASIRVVNSTVASSRPGGSAVGILPVQTFRTDASTSIAQPRVNLIGGANPGATDPGNGVFASAQSITPVLVVTNLYVGNVDFGFNFSTIVNTNDTGQGSLRQFLANANALGNAGLNQEGRTAGQETSIFMIPNGSGSPGFNPAFNFTVVGVATIAPGAALTTVTDPVILDGSTQPGYSTTPVIQLSGQNAGAGINGVTVTAGNSIIRNLAINRFAGSGIVLGTAGGNAITGNFIGTDVAGTVALANGVGVSVTSANNTIGGTTAAARNIIAGNTSDGVRLTGGATGNAIKGNFIGVNRAGSGVLANGGDGVHIESANNTVGGTTAADANVLSGNTGAGVGLNQAAATGNILAGNFIGTDLAGTAALANGIGILIASNATINTIGGTVAGAGNTIANNTGDGIAVTGTSSTRNAIRRNSMFSNGGLGIDLNNDGVTLNDLNDTDTGGNTAFNFPVITSATIAGGNLVLTGFARTNSVIEIFVANPDPAGFGEGQTYVTTLTEGVGDTDNGTGSYSGLINGVNQGSDTTARFTFSIPVPSGVSLGSVLTATATDASGNTSEFNGRAAVGGFADVVVFKTGATSAVIGSNITYAITVTNGGPATAVNLIVRDTLPAGLSFVQASSGGTPTGNVVTWPTIPTFGSGAATNFTLEVIATTAGAQTNVASAVATTADPTPGNNDGSAATNRVVTLVTVPGVNVGGRLFNDLQPNGMADTGENWTTGTNVYVNLVSGGTVIASVAVAPGTGTFTLSNVVAGAYSMVVATTSNSAVAVAPPGWLFTAPTDGIRALTVGSNPVAAQDFGLFHGGRLTGRVFNDNGAGGGVAHNGTNEVGEAGIPNVSVRLTDSGGGTTYGTALTDGAGNYTLYVPFTLGAVPLKVVETNLSPYLSISGSAGTTGGSYVRGTDAVSFNNTPGTSYSGVNFGDVPANTFAPDNNLAALPGTVVFFPHLFAAGSAGTVTFSTTSTTSTNVPGWAQQVLLDANCNGSLDAGDTLVTGPISVTAGQVVCILVKESVPAGAPINAVDVISVQASFGYTGATPALNTTLTRTDTLTVGNTTTAGLVLTKAVDKATALPGETITYTVTYRNNSDGVLSAVVVFDQTPAYTTFVSAGNGVLPSNLTGVTITKPAVGATGAIRWNFTGALAASATGTVNFSVQVAP